MKKVALITGVTGQDGSYLAEFLLAKGYSVHGIIRRSSSFNTKRLENIYRDTEIKHKKFFLHYGDLLDYISLASIIKRYRPSEIYNLAAQSHVKVSFEMPYYTTMTNAIGTLNLLEIIRTLGLKTKFYQASTSELYGNNKSKLSEKTAFNPVSPYAASKHYAYEITKIYRESYGMFCSNGILFNHESPRRGENFISRKTIIGLIKILKGKQKILYLGNLYSKRDWGHAKEFVKAQWQILQQKKPDDFVIATGKNYTVKDLVNLVLKKLKIKCIWKKDKSGLEYAISLSNIDHIKKSQVIVKQDKLYFRPNEVHDLVGNYSKAKRILKWKPLIKFDALITEMINSEIKIIK